MTPFATAYRALQAAEDKAAKAMQKDFPIGSWITYKAGYRRISAQVVSHGYGLRLLVRGMSGKEYPINASRLLS
jgi:hypothetical protein